SVPLSLLLDELFGHLLRDVIAPARRRERWPVRGSAGAIPARIAGGYLYPPAPSEPRMRVVPSRGSSKPLPSVLPRSWSAPVGSDSHRLAGPFAKPEARI